MPEENKIIISNSRSSPIHSCILDKEDLKKLCETLEKKCAEALKIEIDKFKRPDNMEEEDYQKIKENIKNNLKLSVMVIGKKDKHMIGENYSIFDNTDFPEDLSIVNFGNSFRYKWIFGYEPKNIFQIVIDFSKVQILSSVDPSQSTVNNSNITVRGSDETWVSGVYGNVSSFFEGKKTNRDWLHKRFVYLLFLFIFVFPITFRIIYRTDNFLKLLNTNIPSVLSIAIYVYIFFLALTVFRILFNYFRWVFPLIEFKTKAGTKMAKHRGVFYFIVGSIAIAIILDVIRAVF